MLSQTSSCFTLSFYSIFVYLGVSSSSLLILVVLNDSSSRFSCFFLVYIISLFCLLPSLLFTKRWCPDILSLVWHFGVLLSLCGSYPCNSSLYGPSLVYLFEVCVSVYYWPNCAFISCFSSRRAGCSDTYLSVLVITFDFYIYIYVCNLDGGLNDLLPIKHVFFFFFYHSFLLSFAIL